MENWSKEGSNELESPDGDAFQRLCRAVVAKVVARRGWSFIKHIEIPTLAAEVIHEVQLRWRRGERRPLWGMAEQSAVGIYSERWVAACSADGTLAQARGYQALGHYLGVRLPYLAAEWDPILASEKQRLAAIRQEVLLKVQMNLPLLQTPRTFLRWLTRLSNTVIRDYLIRWRGDAMAYVVDIDVESEIEAEPMGSALQYLFTDPLLLERLQRTLAGCLNDDLRLKIIEAFYLEEQEVQEIATLLAMDAKTISQAKFRALERLKRCRALLEFLEDFT